MDEFCSEPSEENNHKEQTGQRRRSSILKPPRSPLQDIRNGNEIGQDFINTRSRKSSRRVSFAETIKVFQTEIPTEVKEEPKNKGKDVGEKVSFIQAKRPEDNQCEIIGMETLLRAPLQVQAQQPEDSDIEPLHEKKYGNDQTVIFSDENQMDLTASHTVMITKGLLNCPQMGKSSKIDTKSFLTNLKSLSEDLTMNKEFNLSIAPERTGDKCSFQSKTSTSSENKVNFNDFIKRLKLEKSVSSSIEGPDKENIFIAHIPSQEPNNDASSLPKKYIFPVAKENSLGVTCLSRGQDDGKDITQCPTDNSQSTNPIIRKTLLRPSEGIDFTAYSNDFMDLTVNSTAQIFLPTNNISRIENHIQNVSEDVTKGDYSTTCSDLVFQGDKTVFFSRNDAMEMTKCLTSKRDNKNSHVSNLIQMHPDSGNAISSLIDKTNYSEEDDMDITKSNTVAIHDQIIELCPTNVQVPSLPNLENELLFQGQEVVSEDRKQNKSCSSVSSVTRGKLQQDLANPLSVSLSGNKSVVFSSEDMDLTKCYTVKIDSSNLGTQLPLTSANVLAPVKTKKPLSPSRRGSSGLETWEEMEITKSHTVPINLHNSDIVAQQKLGPKNTQTQTFIKDGKILELSSYPHKDILHSSVYKMDMTKSHTISDCGESLYRKVALGSIGNAPFQNQSWLSKVKPEDDMERHTIDTPKNTLGQNSKFCESLEKNDNTSHEKTVMFSEQQQNMDLTTSHTAVIGCMPCPSVQESGDLILPNTTLKQQSELQNNTNLLSNLSVMDSIRNNSVAIKMEELPKIDTKSFLKSLSEDVTMNKEFNLSTAPEGIGDKCSFQSKTSTSSENKVNFNDFIKRLKLEKNVNFNIEGPDKENVIPSQESNNDAFSLPEKYIFPVAKENSLGVTSFRGQDDGRDPQCPTDNSQSMDLIARKTLLRPSEGIDFTVYGNDFMDLTVNPTAQTFLPTNNISRIENHIQNVPEGVTKGDYSTKNTGTKKICRNQQNVPCQDLSGNLENEIDITKSHTGMTHPDTHPALQTSKQGSVTLTLASESTYSDLVFQGDKTIFFSSNDDDMEMTKSLTSKRDNKNSHVSNLIQIYSGPGNATSSLIDKTSEEVDMDITKSNTVAIHDQIELCPTNVQVSSLPNLENELLFQDQEVVSEDIKQNKSCSSVSSVPRGRLQQDLANPLSVSLSGNKSVVFSSEDMDLTKCCTVKIDSSNLGTQLPLTSANGLAPVKTKKPPSSPSRPTSQIIPFPLKEAFNSFLQDKGDLQSEKPFGNCQNSLSQPENHTVTNTDVSPEYAHQSLLAMKLVSTNSLLPYPSEKTIIFAPEQDNMDLTENHEVIIQTGNSKILADEQQKQKYSEASMTHEKSSGLLLSSSNKKRMTEIMGNSLEINKVHTVTGDKADLEGGTSRATDKTVVFPDNQDELEITKSHTVVIDYQTMEKMQDKSHLLDSRRKSLGQSKLMFASNDQTVSFSEETGNNLDLTKSHTIVINNQIVPQEDGHKSIPIDKTIMFLSNNDVVLTKSILCMTDKTIERPRLENPQLLDNPAGMNEVHNNKTVIFPAGDENNMEFTNALTKDMNHKNVSEGEQDSCLVSLATASKTVLYRGEQDDMEITDITKSNIFATDHKVDLQDVRHSRKMDKIVVFADNQNDLEITKSHSVVIDYQTIEMTQDRSNPKSSARKSLSGPEMTFPPNDQTVLFSEEDGNDLDLTKSHTTVINTQKVPQGDDHRSIPVDKTRIVISSDDIELAPCMTDKIIEDIGLKTVQLLDKPGRNKNTNNDKTIVFSAGDENDMEITNIPTQEVNHKHLVEDEQDSCFVPLATASKTVLQKSDDMEITKFIKNSTFAMDCEVNFQRLGTCQHVDKTMMFSDNRDELEMTKSHTVVIDYQTMEKTQDSSPKDLRRKSVSWSKMMSAPNDQTVFFSEEDGNDLDLTKSHTTVINSQIVPQGYDNRSFPVDKTIVFTSNNDMELSKPISYMTDKTIERSRLENAQLLDNPVVNKSLNKVYNNKTVVFPTDDEKNMEIISALTKEINYKDGPEGEQDGDLVPLATTSKTVLYRGEQDDMEITDITKSHISATDHEVNLQDLRSNRKMDKTVVFVDNQNELEITKSHTVVIDYQTMENMQNMFPDKAKLDNFKRNSLVGAQLTFVPNTETIYPAGEEVNDRKITKKQTDTSFLQNEQQQSALPYFPAGKTIMFTNDQDIMEIDRSQSTVINEKMLEKVVEQDCALVIAKKEIHPLGNTVLLGKITKTKSETIPLKFPKHQVEAFTDEEEQRQRSELFRDEVFVDSQSQLLSHSIPLLEKEQYIVNKDKLMQSAAQNGNSEVGTGNFCTFNYENKTKRSHDDRKLIPASEKELKQNGQISEWETTVGVHLDLDSASKGHQLHVIPSKLSDLVISSEAISIANITPNLNETAPQIFSQSQTRCMANLREKSPKLGKQTEDSINKSQTPETQNIKIETSNVKIEGKPWNGNGNESDSVPLKATVKDKIKAKRYSLGIFLPKLPNKRNCSVTGMVALEHKSVDLTDLNSLEAQPINKKNSNLMSVLKEPHLSPSLYINEEHLPLDPEESSSSESISIETEGKTLIEMCQQKIQPPESTMKEIFNGQKRLLVQGEDDSVSSGKKVRKDETCLSDSAQALQASDHHIEEYVDKNPSSSLVRSLNRTPSSSSSSDSIKADGTSMNYSMQQSSQMESQFLMDHICEENLKEKLHDGRITVREFFTLLQVHILIQKPRQSNLPANFATNVPSTPKDLLLSQYVYRPKIQIYKEDCQALHQKIEELKLRALKQDKLLVDVNKSLWEVMKGCSDEELKTFGVHLNKMKSRFAKRTKVFAHQGKVVLYSKLVQSAKIEREKLLARMEKMDSVLKNADSCLAALDLEIKKLDKNEDFPMTEWDSEMLATEKELEQLQAEEKELKRNISELEIQKQQALTQINCLQREAKRIKGCLEKFNCSEWEIIEWSDSQAVFTFLYDSIELTITFGEPVDGLPFLNKTCRKINDVNFKTLLHENKAPPSSLLVHRLIFQFIEDQESWKNKCITQHHVPKMLQEISLVVSRCRLLGEEIEFLNRWGPNYNLMNIDVNNNEVKLLFSSSAAFAKFELTLTLSAHYPSVPLSFTIQNLIGNIAKDKIAAILTNVPLDNNYLKTAVKCIYQDLLQG